MDNKTKNLLISAIDKCSKLTQYCSKSIKFGLFNHHPNKNKTNGDEILIKYYQIQSIIENLQNDHVLPIYSRDYINRIKRDVLNEIKNTKSNKNK